MKKSTIILIALMCSMMSFAQGFKTTTAKFQFGDNQEWKNPSFNDSGWQEIPVAKNWLTLNMNRENTYAWYRIHFTPTDEWIKAADQKDIVHIVVGYIDDADVTYLNGEKIGGMGNLPDDPQGFSSAWNSQRVYTVPLSKLKMNQDNVIAVRMWNGDGEGGMSCGEDNKFYAEAVYVQVPSRVDKIGLTATGTEVKGKKMVKAEIVNNLPSTQNGVVEIIAFNPEANITKTVLTKSVSLGGNKSKTFYAPLDADCLRYYVKYTDPKLNKSTSTYYSLKYILTPKAPKSPRFNMAGVFGVRPGSPVIYRFPVSGERPMKFSISNLPKGLSLDAENGVLSGKLTEYGDYTLDVTAENAHGKADAKLTIKVGDVFALTPPMGWNSWNCWGLSVSQERVMSSAKALIDKGLADYGYSYINIDDAWEAAKRNPDGTIAVNEKFTDMKALGDWLHERGLKFGIYSSPGNLTCGRYLGSLDHELQDAETYNSWGIDYLKYDWCGYGKKHPSEPDRNLVSSYIRPYLFMQRHLRQQPRDIFYSLCQYGMMNVWEWGAFIDANSWRTTGDITDTWKSLYSIGFEKQVDLYPYSKPGHWNDPDMIIVGKVGWSDKLRDSRLTPDEQYTHISLWCLLAANMLIGCDLAQLDDFTVALLCNNEVNAINQDTLGKQAQRVVDENDIQIWMRPLADGGYALGVFNLGNEDKTVDCAGYFNKLGLTGKAIRDLWRQKDLNTTEYFIPTHGVRMLKFK